MSLRSLRGLVCLAFLSLFFFSCSKEESLELNMPSMPTSGGSALYALSVSSGTCMNADVQGTYKKNVATDATNKVAIEVNVNTVGTWTVSSAAITGFYFSGSGSFAAAGTQTIILNAHGTPNTAGTQTFTLIVGSTNCTFEVDVDSTGSNPTPVSGEYFPLTQGSWWSYDDGTGDTSKTVVSGQASMISKTFERFVNSYEASPDTDTTLYRKDATANAYYMFEDLSDLASLGLVIAQPKVEVLFLKNTVTSGATWNNDFSATLNGLPVTVRVKITCVNNNETLNNINGNNFTNVIHEKMELQVGTGPIFNSIETVDLYFAKGVGMVKSENTTDVTTIRYWHVN